MENPNINLSAKNQQISKEKQIVEIPSRKIWNIISTIEWIEQRRQSDAELENEETLTQKMNTQKLPQNQED